MSMNADTKDEKNMAEKEESSLYRGKWTPEEEAYSHGLIAEFRAGTLSIPSGTTLRSFLAKKLNCAPKRVSKKFENTGYNGKQLYCTSIVYISRFESEFRKRNLEFLHQRFLISRGLPGKAEIVNTPQDFMVDQNNGSTESNVGGTSFLEQRLNESVMSNSINRPGFLGNESSSRMRLMNLSSRLANTRNSPSLGPACMVDQGRVEALRRDLQTPDADSSSSLHIGMFNRTTGSTSASWPSLATAVRSGLSASDIAEYSKALSSAATKNGFSVIQQQQQQQQQPKRAPSPLERSLNQQSLLNNRVELLKQTLGLSNTNVAGRSQLQQMLSSPSFARSTQLSLLQAEIQAENRKRQTVSDGGISNAAATAGLLPPTKRSKMF